MVESCCSHVRKYLIEWSVITGREGQHNRRGGGASEVLPLENSQGGGRVLAILGRDTNSFGVVLTWVL